MKDQAETKVETTTATTAFRAVKDSAEAIMSDAPQRFPEAASHGDYFRQGDLYITKIDGLPTNTERVPPAEVRAQLAPGETKGSRHILSHMTGVVLFRKTNATPLDGPIVCTETEVDITHPEHGDVTCGPGIYAITHQRAFADEIRRVAD